MEPDPLQAAWQSQPSPPIDAGRLAEELARGQQQFDAIIFWRDAGEVGVALILLPVWVVMGVWSRLPWTWYLAMPGIAFIAAFPLIDRRRQRRLRPGPDAPLVRGVEGALAEVEHQAWLLRNVGWWYLLPLFVPMLAFFGQVAWHASGGDHWRAAAGASIPAAFVSAVFAGIYGINRKAIRTTLEPRRRELAETLRALSEVPPAGPPG